MGAIVVSYVSAPVGTPQALPQFVDGLQHALLVAAAIAFVSAIVAVSLVRQVRHAPETTLAEAA
jgi:hypothetical protein